MVWWSVKKKAKGQLYLYLFKVQSKREPILANYDKPITINER
jgi:hypothetical protein